MTDLPLYPTEAQIARKVLGPGRLDEWKGIVQVLERSGFPKVDPLFGGRYWKLCEQWFDVWNRLIKPGPEAFYKRDGGETIPQPRKPRGTT